MLVFGTCCLVRLPSHAHSGPLGLRVGVHEHVRCDPCEISCLMLYNSKVIVSHEMTGDGSSVGWGESKGREVRYCIESTGERGFGV